MIEKIKQNIHQQIKQNLLFFGLFICALVLVVSAFILEHGFGAAPCHLCWLQRYGHWALLFTAGLGLFLRGIPYAQKIAFWGCIAAILYGLCLGGYHVLVQQKLIAGPQGCSSVLALPQSTQGLLEALKTVSVPRCDKVNFTVLGQSLAVWNVLFMAALLAFVYKTKKP